MHGEIKSFLSQVRHVAKLGDQPRLRVVEIGSYDMNGSPREVFAPVARSYVGVDHRPGPGVDIVSLAHAYTPAQPFDLAVCCQMLEHDPFWTLTLVHLAWLVREGGIVIVTCAGPGYVRHELDTSPGYDPALPADQHHYRNVSVAEVGEVLRAAARYVDLDVEVHGETARDGLDTLVWARFTVPSGG